MLQTSVISTHMLQPNAVAESAEHHERCTGRWRLHVNC